MEPNHPFRTLFCICFVLALHFTIFYIWHIQNNSVEKTVLEPDNLLYVSIVPLSRTQITPSFFPLSKSNKKLPAEVPTRASAAPVEPISVTLSDSPQLDLDTLRAGAVQQELKRARSPIGLQQEKIVGITVWKPAYSKVRTRQRIPIAERRMRVPVC